MINEREEIAKHERFTGMKKPTVDPAGLPPGAEGGRVAGGLWAGGEQVCTS